MSETAGDDAEMTLLKGTIIDNSFPTRKMEPTDAKFYARKRYLVMILMFLVSALSYVLKGNLSIVLTDIAYPKYILKGNRTIYQEPQVNWSSKQVGFILGVITCGEMPGIFIAGILAKKYGGATLLGGGLLVASLCACCTPAVINTSYFWLFVIVRIIEGFGSGLIDGSLCEICLHWSPIKERARYINSTAMSGTFGVISSNIATGYGIHYFNWKIVFFATGGTGILLFIVWLLLVRSRPSDDKFILNVERRFLEAEINLPSEKTLKLSSYPWKEIFTSKPVWAYMNECFCCSWSATFIAFCLPLYIKDITKQDIHNVALMSSIPMLFCILSEFTFSSIHDCIRSRKKTESSAIHRIILSCAHLGVAISFITAALWVNFVASLILISIIRIFIGIKYVYYNVMAVDVFYRYAGLIRNLGQIGGLLPLIFTPLLIGIIVTNHERSQWSVFFGILVVFNILSILVFNRYGSLELQSWASVPVDVKDKTSLGANCDEES